MGISLPNVIIILIVALLVIGPKKLPDIAKSLGKGYAEFRRAFNDLKKSVDLTADSNSRTQNSAAANKDTYKSRWEEQIIAPEEKSIPAEPAIKQNEQNEKPESPLHERAKRADLIKED